MDFIRGFFEGQSPWYEAFALHGGAHRLAVPKFFFLIEYGVFSGSNTFLIISSICFQLAVIFCIYFALKKEQHISTTQRTFFTALTAVLMFNTTQLENFIYTFDMQWFATTSFAVLALYHWVVFFNKTNQGSITLIWALLATMSSMFSSFSGVCLLFVIPVLALYYQNSRKSVLIITILCLSAFLLYISGPFADGGDWGNNEAITLSFALSTLLSWLVLLLKWTALYFGSPLGRDYFWAGALFAYGSLLFLAWQWWQMLWPKITQKATQDHKSAFQVFALSLALFAAAVGIITGLGRMYFVNTADEDRYQSIVLIYWLGIFAYSYSACLQRRLINKARYCYLATMGLLLFWTVIVIPVWGIKDARAQVTHFNRVNNSNLAIAAKQYDFQAIKATLILGDKWKKINRPAMHADFLAEQSWGIFNTPLARSLNESSTLSQFTHETLENMDKCPAAFHTATQLNPPYSGYQLGGQISPENITQAPTAILALDTEKKLVGLGRLQHPKEALSPPSADKTLHWLLYTRSLPPKAKTLSLLAQLPNDALCVMGSAKLRVLSP